MTTVDGKQEGGVGGVGPDDSVYGEMGMTVFRGGVGYGGSG